MLTIALDIQVKSIKKFTKSEATRNQPHNQGLSILKKTENFQSWLPAANSPAPKKVCCGGGVLILSLPFPAGKSLMLLFLTVHTFLLSWHTCPCVVMGSLAVKGKNKYLTYIPQLAETQDTAKEVFTLPAGSWEEEPVPVHRVPAQRVTQSQHGREAAKRGNGEFQVNALCFHNNSWFALNSLKNNSLRDSGGTGGNYHETHLFTFP